MTGLWSGFMTLQQRVLSAVVVLAVLGAGVTAVHVSEGGRTTVSEPPAGVSHEVATCTAWSSPSGSDSTGAGSQLRPYRSAQRLLRSLPAGGTGCLRTGRYVGDVTLLRDDTTLRSAPGDRAVLAVASLTVPAGVDRATVSHLDIVGGRGALTVRLVGDGFLLTRNDISNQGGASCVLVGASDHRTRGGRIVENVIHGCGRDGNHLDHGIYAQNVGPAPGPEGRGLLVEGNVLYDLASYAVQLYPQSLGSTVRRNVIDGGGRSVRGGVILDGPVSVSNRIEANVIARTRTGAVVQRTGSSQVSQDNCFWRNGQGISGPTIRSTGDRSSDACWLPADLWGRTGKAAADEPCTCPDRAAATCSADRSDSLCRLLKSSGGRTR